MGFDGRSGKTPIARQRISTCRACGWAIYTSEARIWANRVEPSKAAGLVHYPTCENPKPGVTVVQTSGQPVVGGQHTDIKRRINKH